MARDSNCYPKRTTLFALLQMLASLSVAQKRWSVSSIQSVDPQVSAQTDLQWTLQSSVPISQNDCVQIQIPNPYRDSALYESFSQALGSFECSIDNYPGVECSALSTDKFQLLFTQDHSQQQTLLVGQTLNSVFKNPFSATRLSGVSVTHLKRCDPLEILVEKQIQLSSLQLATIPEGQIEITSSSQQLAATDAILQVKVQPATSMQQEGRVMIKSPAWYKKEAIGQEGVTQDFWAESMISDDADVTIESSVGTIELQEYQFDFSSKILTIKYLASEEITSSDTVTVHFTNFRNPVNNNEPVTGFQVSTTDSSGNFMDQSANNLLLQTLMTIPQTMSDVQVKMLGDQQGQYEGMIVTLQTFQMTVSLNFPLEPFCYFEIALPQTLRLEENVQAVTGTGIFQPFGSSNNLNSGQFGQFQVDAENNIIMIQGCRLSEYLTENPYGTFVIQSIKMPSYIVQIDPISMKAYSDVTLQQVMIDHPDAYQINVSDLMPGLFEVEMFKPSNQYASATKVAYTLHVRPQHTLPPTSRIVIEMPELLTFNRTAGCEVVMTVCNCSLAEDSNTLTLTNIFDKEFEGGTLLKFIILSATNPLGSRPAGPWSIRSEMPVNGVFHQVDGQNYAESFYALSGTILSELSISNERASNENTIYDFSIRTEHDIPVNGKIKVKFPDETPVLLDSVSDIFETGLPIISVENRTVTFLAQQGSNSDIPVTFSIAGVQNVRSLQPSSAFEISTLDLQNFIVDQGGQDIIAQMKEPAIFQDIQLLNPNKTNGAIISLNISINLKYSLRDNDTLHLVIPQDISFDQNVTCIPHSLVQAVDCSHSGAELQIRLALVTQQTPGLLQIEVIGMRNPSSFKASQPFQGIYISDPQGFKSQAWQDLQFMILQTNEQAIVQDYIQAVDSEEYSAETPVTLQFQTMNPVSSEGVILLKWPESVTLFDTTYCKVTTHKQILRQNTCLFDHQKRELLIQGSFAEVPPSYTGTITIGLSRIVNPSTNQNLGEYSVETFNDPEFKYPVDVLRVQPKLKCYWPCFNCGQQKDYCTACWDEPKFLFSSNLKSTCMDACPAGWTSNGTATPWECRQCDFTCGTCQDIGLPNDVQRCLTCQADYPYFLKVENNTGQCQAVCQHGYYDIGSNTCGKCARNCDTCLGTSTNCTGCNQESTVPVLMNSKCIGECPIDHTDILGECSLCESPCATCDQQTDMCSSCDGTDDLKYLFGLNCVSQCPGGTVLNKEKMACEGCRTGCLICQKDDPAVCEKCQDGYLTLGFQCVNTCPEGHVQTFSGFSCRSLSDIDARLVYFPFLVTVLLLAVLSAIGKLVKPKHLFLANFVVMTGFIEHVALFVQVCLTFAFGTYLLAIFIVLIWLGYIATLICFNVFWRRDVYGKDQKFRAYREDTENRVSSKIRFILGLIVNWRSHKLLYSHFFGVKVNAFHFTDSQTVVTLMNKIQLANIGATYAPLIIYNIIALALGHWGTQLYIMWIENIVIALIMLVCSLIEHKQMAQDFLSHEKKQVNMTTVSKSIKGKKALIRWIPIVNESMNTHRYVFMQRKLDQLLEMFGTRRVLSEFDHTQEERKEADTRKIRSFPMSPQLPPVEVDDPPRPLFVKLINNCYATSFFEEGRQMKRLNGTGLNKHCQKGGPFDDDKHRADTYLVSHEEDTLEYIKFKAKKVRGRKNKYTNEIDGWDNKNGAALDTDADGQSANFKLRAEYLQSIREEDEVLKRTKVTAKKLLKSNTKSTISGGVSPRKSTKRDQSVTSKAAGVTPRKTATIQSATTDERLNLSTVDAPVKKQKVENKKQAAKVPKIQQVTVAMRNFNEFDVLGTVDRDRHGKVIEPQAQDGQYKDLVGRSVNAQGYLLDKDKDIVHAQDPSHKVFRKIQLVDGLVPAPYFFEKYNFNAFSIFGHFVYQDPSDVTSLIIQKAMHKHQTTDDSKRDVNAQGFLIGPKKAIIDGQGRTVLDKKHLTKEGMLRSLYNWQGESFKLTDVMGCFKLNDQSQIKIEDGSKDLSGHLVTSKGYLTNQEGDILNRKGHVLFKSQELKNGEFPKIFKFSKFNMGWIQGNFNRDEQKKPILFSFPGGDWRDEDSRLCSQKGYLIDDQGNVVDRQKNILIEKYLMQEDGRLPPLFRTVLLTGDDQNNDDEFTDLLQQIENDLETPVQGQTIQDPDDSQQQLLREQHRKAANRTFNNQSPGGLAPEDMSSDGRSSVSPQKRFKNQKKQYKLVKQEQYHEKDKAMANVYGGEAQPRVRMIPKRFASNVRERPSGGQVLRDSSILSPTQMMASQEIITTQQKQVPPMLDLNIRTRTQLDHSVQRPDIMSAGRESNAAISVKNLHQLRKQMMDGGKTSKEQPAADLLNYQGQAQDEMNRFMDGFNFQLQSMGDFSEQMSNGTFAEINMPSEQMKQQLLDKSTSAKKD